MATNNINNTLPIDWDATHRYGAGTVPPGCQPAGLGAISVWVAGVPAPQGSKRPLGRQGGFGKHIMIEQSTKVKPWREDVRQAFLDQRHPETAPHVVFGGASVPIIVKIVFVLPRTKAMRDRPAADFPMVQKPDLDKLGRAVLDALKSAGVYADDSQVVTLLSHKRRAEPGEPTGAMIHIERDPSRCQPLCRMLQNGQGGHPGPCMIYPEERVDMSMFDSQPPSDLG
jgi:crossover junction endodeoxyribonuclease RusA